MSMVLSEYPAFLVAQSSLLTILNRKPIVPKKKKKRKEKKTHSPYVL